MTLAMSWRCIYSVFCFKQKTADEMRISDWSSDVCSSDLGGEHAGDAGRLRGLAHDRVGGLQHAVHLGAVEVAQLQLEAAGAADAGHRRRRSRAVARPAAALGGRSEEHTSELQSLMRTSYAVFCLKKKNIQTQSYTTTLHSQQYTTRQKKILHNNILSPY